MKPKPVVVRWIDSCRFSGWNSTTEDWAKWKPSLCETRGLLLDRNKTRLLVATTVGFDDKGVVDQVCDAMAIPLACVKSIRPIK